MKLYATLANTISSRSIWLYTSKQAARNRLPSLVVVEDVWKKTKCRRPVPAEIMVVDLQITEAV